MLSGIQTTQLNRESSVVKILIMGLSDDTFYYSILEGATTITLNILMQRNSDSSNGIYINDL